MCLSIRLCTLSKVLYLHAIGPLSLQTTNQRSPELQRNEMAGEAFFGSLGDDFGENGSHL